MGDLDTYEGAIYVDVHGVEGPSTHRRHCVILGTASQFGNRSETKGWVGATRMGEASAGTASTSVAELPTTWVYATTFEVTW